MALYILLPVQYITIIPQARVGYEMVDNHLISNKGEWNNCFIKNAPKYSKLNLKKKLKTPQKKSRVRLPYLKFVEHGIMALSKFSAPTIAFLAF